MSDVMTDGSFLMRNMKDQAFRLGIHALHFHGVSATSYDSAQHILQSTGEAS